MKLHATLDDSGLGRHALATMATQVEPVGAGTVALELERAGYTTSPATVGRLLRDLETRGFLQRVGMEGRLITEEGRRTLIELNQEAVFRAHGEALMDAITNGGFTTKADALALLAARKPLEIEIARLAAQNATVAQIKKMRAAIEEQKRHLGDEALATEADIRFHEAVAEGSQNVYLKPMISLLRRHTGYARIITHISRKSGNALAAEHQSILDAVIARDPHRAEQAAELHMLKLLRTIEKYWTAPDATSLNGRHAARPERSRSAVAPARRAASKASAPRRS